MPNCDDQGVRGRAKTMGELRNGRVCALAVLLCGVIPPAVAGAAPPDWREAPIVPAITAPVAENLRGIAKRGDALGNRATVFAKVGDSITDTPAFLTHLACEAPQLGAYGRLAGTIGYFGASAVAPPGWAACGVVNSYSRESVAAVPGWTSADARSTRRAGCELADAIACELAALRPAIALVMLGTNDVEEVGARGFRRNLAGVVSEIERAGTIPIVSTIPPRRGLYADKSERFNREIALLAANRRIPLWNYWRQMAAPRVPSDGLSNDGVHPSLACPDCSAIDFTQAGLRFGYGLRNLGALLALERVRHRVF